MLRFDYDAAGDRRPAALSLGLTLRQMPADGRILSMLGMVACVGAALLMLAVDVPMYFARWRLGRNSGVRYLSMTEGG